MSSFVATQVDILEKKNILCALQFQLEDAEEFSRSSLSDSEDVASKFIVQDLKSMINLQIGFIRALEFQISVREASNMAASFEAMRIQEETDENFARNLGGLPPILRQIETVDIESEILDDEPSIMRKSILKAHVEPSYDPDYQLPKSMFSRRKLPDAEFFNVAACTAISGGGSIYSSTDGDCIPNEFFECYACADKFPELYSFPCKHRICKDCLLHLVESAIKDRSLLPLKCCRLEIDPNCCELVLPPGKKLDKFRQFIREASASRKCYCPNQNCSEFINIDLMETLGEINDNGAYFCPSCNFPLCVRCTTGHPNQTCDEFQQKRAEAEGQSEFLALVRSQGYSQCNKCKFYVELTVGCNHMTCTCGYQFCYVCNAKWKNCQCLQWQEERLLLEAERRAGDDAHIPAVVDRFRNNILFQEGCNHKYGNVSGFVQVDRRYSPGCDNCGFAELYLYHFRCLDCDTRVCQTCRYHRL